MIVACPISVNTLRFHGRDCDPSSTMKRAG
jgi:hypothetical protein